MSYGTVKWFNSRKPYGFIQPADGSDDVFVHMSAVEGSGLTELPEGQEVTFEIECGEQGKASAINLQPCLAKEARSAPASLFTTAELRQIVMEIMG